MFSGLVMRLLAKDPADRPQSAQEVVAAIEALESGEAEEDTNLLEETASRPIRAAEAGRRRPDGGRPKRPRVRRKKNRPEAERDWGLWVLAAGAALLIVALVVLLFTIIRRHG
jgi:hypothetical protein